MKCPHCNKRIIVKMIKASTGRPKVRKRKLRTGTLAVAIEKYLREYGRPAKVANIAEDLLERGVTTKAKNFRAVVNRTLVIDKRFKQARRGYYQLARVRRSVEK